MGAMICAGVRAAAGDGTPSVDVSTTTLPNFHPPPANFPVSPAPPSSFFGMCVLTIHTAFFLLKFSLL